MKRYMKNFLMICLCFSMVLHTFSVYANTGSMARGTYMSSAKIFAKVVNEDDIIGNVNVVCLAQVEEIDVNMYLQQAYGNVWKNVSAPFNMNVTDTNMLDESAVVRNVAPGTYRIYIEVRVTGYDGLFDVASGVTGSITVNT